MTTYRWTYADEPAAQGHYTRLIAAGCQASKYLAYAGEGWAVTSTSANAPAVLSAAPDPFTGCGVPGCVPGRPCPPCAADLAGRHTSPATLAWCAERGHPWSTYNASLNRSYCRCGARQENGEREIDMDAIWSTFHDHLMGAPCSCAVRAQEASRRFARGGAR
jgi:hypothetical protein